MNVFIDDKNRIMDVGESTNDKLTKVFIDETLENYPFKGWNEEKLKCYKVTVDEKGEVLVYNPFVPDEFIDVIERLEGENAKLRNSLEITSSTLESVLIDTIPALLDEIEKLKKE